MGEEDFFGGMTPEKRGIHRGLWLEEPFQDGLPHDQRGARKQVHQKQDANLWHDRT